MKLVDALKSTAYVMLRVLPVTPVFANALTAKTSEKVRTLFLLNLNYSFTNLSILYNRPSSLNLLYTNLV